ncbi:MAG: hypothetical protein AAF638_13800 [Pseudomonadota bacterium]
MSIFSIILSFRSGVSRRRVFWRQNPPDLRRQRVCAPHRVRASLQFGGQLFREFRVGFRQRLGKGTDRDPGQGKADDRVGIDAFDPILSLPERHGDLVRDRHALGFSADDGGFLVCHRSRSFLGLWPPLRGLLH